MTALIKEIFAAGPSIPLMLDFMIAFLLGSSLVSLVRVVIGPTASDRMIGLNLVSGQILALLVLLAVRGGHEVYLDVALVYDIFGFVGLLAITHYLQKGGEEH
jgi:multisubunit Na+/H+ antiporter MnhF subunit